MTSRRPFHFILQCLITFLSFQLCHGGDTSCVGDALAELDSRGFYENGVNLVVHRNGEPEPCAIATLDREAFKKATEAVVKYCSRTTLNINKYQMESMLTAYLADQLDAGSCGSTDNATAPEGILGHCDMGPLRTPIQPDNTLLIQQPGGSLPCRFFTREGRRVSAMRDLAALADSAVKNKGKCEEDDHTCQSAPTLHLYAAPAGRVFMFAPSFVGEKFVVDHVQGADDNNLVLEVISLNPRLFEIYDFFSKEEATALIEKTLNITDETYGLHRSRTGATSKSIFNKRTSENAWDTNGEVALEIKGRCMEMLGFDEYWDGHTDGLQILRYKNAQAYTAHHDYLKASGSKKDPYDYNTAGVGGNRFATILLYMTDLGDTDGGETLFESATRPGFDSLPPAKEALRTLRESGDPNLAVLEADSWEEEMTALCRSRLSIQPRKGRAVLFYSQHPNGKQDMSVKHGGCPVLQGTKWAANLWVWNAPRTGNRYAPTRADYDAAEAAVMELHVNFRNTKNDPRFANAEIWYRDKTNFGDLGHGKSFRAKTYKGHVWNIKDKVSGETLRTHKIEGKVEEEEVEV